MQNQDDVIIEMLRFIQTQNFAGKEVTFNDVLMHLQGRGYFKDQTIDWSMQKRWVEQVFYNDVGWEITGGKSSNRMLKLDAYLALLDHDELQLARSEAKSAKRTALIAIGLNVLAILLSVWIGLEQLGILHILTPAAGECR